MSSFNTLRLRQWLTRIQAGDETARDELLRCAGQRLELLARKMIRSYPDVRRHADTNDVLQNALMRLLTAVRTASPADTREFFALGARQMRGELLDLAQQVRRIPPHLSLTPTDKADEQVQELVSSDEPEDLARWELFHREAEKLPPEQREVLSLVFYHGWEQADVAELLGVSVRTVQRQLAEALATLRRRVREEQNAD